MDPFSTTRFSSHQIAAKLHHLPNRDSCTISGSLPGKLGQDCGDCRDVPNPCFGYGFTLRGRGLGDAARLQVNDAELCSLKPPDEIRPAASSVTHSGDHFEDTELQAASGSAG